MFIQLPECAQSCPVNRLAVSSVQTAIVRVFVALATLLFATVAMATTYQHTGKIDTIHISDAYLNRDGAWIRVEGFDTAGTCLASGNGLIWMMARNNDNGRSQYALAMSAFLSGLTVTVSVDDAQKASDGVCYLRTIYLAQP